MIKDLISVITPCFNSKETILDTYKSICCQTFSNWEWIVCDDCSSDGSTDILDRISNSDKRVKVIYNEKNSGTAKCRNNCLEISNGQYITFLDSDDLLDATYLESQINFIKKNGPIISAGYRRKTPNSCTPFCVPSETDYKKLLKGNPLSCLTTMYDASVIGKVYFPIDYLKCEDYVFWLDILKKGFIAKGNPEILATYNILKNSKSRKKVTLIKYMFKVYHKSQKINFFKSIFLVINWAFYGLKKYKDVR